MVFLVDHVPAAEVEVNVHWLVVFFLRVIGFVERTDVLRIELRRNLSKIDISSKHGLMLVGCVNLHYCLDQPLLQRWSSLGGPSPGVSPLIYIDRGLFEFEVHFLHDGHHEVIQERRFSRSFRVHCSNDGKLVGV